MKNVRAGRPSALLFKIVSREMAKSVLSFALITFLHPIQILVLQIEFFGEKCAL